MAVNANDGGSEADWSREWRLEHDRRWWGRSIQGSPRKLRELGVPVGLCDKAGLTAHAGRSSVPRSVRAQANVPIVTKTTKRAKPTKLSRERSQASDRARFMPPYGWNRSSQRRYRS
jgi:hypothetical protein